VTAMPPQAVAAIRDAALEMFGDIVADETERALGKRLAELEAAVRASERRRVLAEVRYLAREHGAIYFAEPRPCDCKPGCGTVTSKRMPFANIIPEA
jgi:hypothetical protein